MLLAPRRAAQDGVRAGDSEPCGVLRDDPAGACLCIKGSRSQSWPCHGCRQWNHASADQQAQPAKHSAASGHGVERVLGKHSSLSAWSKALQLCQLVQLC